MSNLKGDGGLDEKHLNEGRDRLGWIETILSEDFECGAWSKLRSIMNETDMNLKGDNTTVMVYITLQG